MSEDVPDRRLVSISTLWSVVFEAHDPQAEAAQAAQRQLLERYGGAVRKYLLKSTGDPEKADDLYQEFALGFLRGDYRNVHPSKGRFRDYLKTVLYHLIGRQRRQDYRQPRPLDSAVPERGVEADPADHLDAEFLEGWRNELLARCWAALARAEQQGGRPYHSVLCFRGANPTMSSQEMARQLGDRLGRPLSPVGVRQLLHRARERFSELLVEEVAQSLAGPTPELLVEELTALGLYQHCEPAVLKRLQGP
jgi:RNA polymerase sigma-70 factor (ECF subfamily)